MQTPSLSTRVTYAGLAVLAVLLTILCALVYFTLEARLEATLDDVLAARLDIAVGLSDDFQGEELADRLLSAGVPALVEAPDGQEFLSEPAVPRTAPAPPVPPLSSPEERVSVRSPLPGGGEVTVYASRAGISSTLRGLLFVELAGSAAMLLLASLLLRRAGDQALAPLDQMVDAAGRTAAGKVGERLNPQQPETKLGQLASAYDDMLDALEGALEDARASDESTHRFLSDAAHQLRTPIAGLRASVESLLREPDPDERDRLLGNLVRETGRAGRIVNSLLHMARLDRGRRMNPQPTDLVALCADEVERAESLAPHLAIDLHADDTPRLHVDPEEMREALSNLLDNARRHADSQIIVALSAHPDHVEIKVRDDGGGVPTGKEEAIFDRFATLDGRGGSGLGLPIARAVVEAHGGDLSYDGRAFVLRLPTTRHLAADPAGD